MRCPTPPFDIVNLVNLNKATKMNHKTKEIDGKSSQKEEARGREEPFFLTAFTIDVSRFGANILASLLIPGFFS